MCRVVYHPKYLAYDLGANHPFSPLRVEILVDLLRELGAPFDPVQPEPVSVDQVKAIHDPEYVDIVEAASRGEEVPDPARYGLGGADNPIVTGMAEAARHIAGGTLHGARLLLDGTAQKVLQLGGGFHHAHRALAAGFCLYNDLALALREMASAGWHVAYLDIDVHHGDGVQELFYGDGQVMTISLHESGEYLFPGTGWLHELGRGMGRSLKINLPLEPFTEGDSYLEVIEGTVEPALSWFRPNALVVQAGADAHFSDPLADLMLTTQDYVRVFERILQLADSFAQGRILFTLGGGYSIRATVRIWTILYLLLHGKELPERLPQAWRARWRERLGIEFPEMLHDPNPAFDPIPRKPEVVRLNRELIRRLNDAVAADWL